MPERNLKNSFPRFLPFRIVAACSIALLAGAACIRPGSSPCELSVITAPDDVDLVSAEMVATTPDNPSHCKVDGIVGSDVKFELLLPDTWNGKLVMGGGGGFVGRVENQAQQNFTFGGSPLSRGYATVGTDTGHHGSAIDASWARDNLERKLNFGYRAVHATATSAKALVRSYYGRRPRRSYFMGCSRGGGQAMMESQLYPEDFDGIVAGAPAFNWNGIAAGFIRNEQVLYRGSVDAPVLTRENRELLEKRILERCDELDGVRDRVVDDPRRCDFRLSEIPACAGDRPATDCLTAAQRDAIEVIYGGPKRGRESLYFGFPFGGENDRGGWDSWIVGAKDAIAPGVPNLHYAFGTQAFKYLFLDDPDFDYQRYDFGTFEEDTKFGASFLNATDTDLSDFEAGGGKLIMWHGWSDPALTALATIDYYRRVEAGKPQVRDFFRLFLMPGVLHCGDGPGPDKVDWLGAIDEWVQNGTAPARLGATRLDESGNPARTRPLCPYPQVAIYDGKGDPNDAANFACGERK
jgi:Tannase and feruloyl esterase